MHDQQQQQQEQQLSLTDQRFEVACQCRHVLLLQTAAGEQQAQQLAVALVLFTQEVVPAAMMTK
jgi:hypothetical protein